MTSKQHSTTTLRYDNTYSRGSAKRPTGLDWNGFVPRTSHSDAKFRCRFWQCVSVGHRGREEKKKEGRYIITPSFSFWGTPTAQTLTLPTLTHWQNRQPKKARFWL